MLGSEYCIDKLRVMHFVNCQMTNISGPESVKVFQAAGDGLRKVNLSHNRIQSVPHGFFQICTKIESLILAHNQIAAIPWTLSLLTNMTECDLSGNRLTDEALESATFPRSIKVLNLAKNQSLTRVPAWIYDSKVLETVDLSENKLRNWNEQSVNFRQCVIRHFDVSNNA